MSIVRLHVRVKGRVQGVFYRESTKDAALDHGVFGWIRNCSDGSVEAILEGKADAVERVLEFMRVGPSQAQVQELEAAYDEVRRDFDSFKVIRN